MPNIPLRATGTEDPQACAQQQPQQRIREPMQRGAARCDEHSARDHNTNDRKPLDLADIRDAKRRRDTRCKSEGDGTRTRNLRIDSPVLENANVETKSTCNNANSNTSSIPSSQAQETRVFEPYLTSIEQALGELPSVERDAVAQHINALATMSKKRRYAILTLTEEET